MSRTIKIISVLIGVFVGIMVTAQFRTTTPLSSSFPLDQIRAQESLIQTYIEEENVLKSRIGSLRKKIDESLEQNEAVSETASLERLNELKKEIGLTKLTGEGFTIQLDDSPFIDRENITSEEGGIVYAADIRDIVNLLRSHNVSGLAINEQRIIASTTITSVGNTVLVNNSHLAPPFTISAIGDYDSLLRRLQDAGVLEDLQRRVEENGIKFSIDYSPYVVLPIYNGQFRLKYLTKAS
jgi:uncharacterized protein YlxW (UPF0749 family)